MITNSTKNVYAKDRLYGMIDHGELDPAICSHMGEIQNVVSSAEGCEDCLKIGSEWVNLRICLICGHVGCCDSSPNRHATAHYHATSHPIIQSFNPGEEWVYCYPDDVVLSS
jgi:uncharacterized UBP type Zn finger protein